MDDELRWCRFGVWDSSYEAGGLSIPGTGGESSSQSPSLDVDALEIWGLGYDRGGLAESLRTRNFHRDVASANLDKARSGI